MKIVYGKLFIKRYKVSNHFHVIITADKEYYYSVGLTHSPNGRNLHPVKESNGNIAFLKNTATKDKKKKYDKKDAKFHIDIESEKIASKMVYKKYNKK